MMHLNPTSIPATYPSAAARTSTQATAAGPADRIAGFGHSLYLRIPGAETTIIPDLQHLGSAGTCDCQHRRGTAAGKANAPPSRCLCAVGLGGNLLQTSRMHNPRRHDNIIGIKQHPSRPGTITACTAWHHPIQRLEPRQCGSLATSLPLDGGGSAVPSLQLHPVFDAVSSRVPPGNTISRFVSLGDKSWDNFKNFFQTQGFEFSFLSQRARRAAF